MKNFVKYLLQKSLGYERYLRVFSKYKIRTLKNDAKEKDFFAFMDAIDQEGAIMDVGANIGIMTYHLATRFNDRKIFAVEPMPNNFAILKQIVEKNKLTNVELIPSAVGDEKALLKMVLPLNGKVKMQGLAHVVHDSIDEWNEGEQIDVNCELLDDIADGEKIAGIKMDIENFEYFALKGASDLLKKDKPVVYLELWENENRDKCFEFLRSLNYQAFIQSENGLIPFDPASHKKQNFIFK
ncbi:MAG: FkbM family methyltransferase [Crocinitomix sp.]|nr:FkbM family methyltransferase [Crocinitomix sp.]